MLGKIRLAVALFAFGGCGVHEPVKLTPPRASLPIRPEQPILDADWRTLPGRWESECAIETAWNTIEDRPKDLPYVQSRFHLRSSGAFTIETGTYTHSDCAAGNRVRLIRVEGHYESSAKDGLEIFGEGMTIEFYAPAWAEFARVANGTGYCGIHDWRVGEPRDVSETACMGKGGHTFFVYALTNRALQLRRYYSVGSDARWEFNDVFLSRR